MKPCRYCGEETNITLEKYWKWKWDDKPTGYFVRCGYCGARGPVRRIQQEAVILWDGDKIIIREDKKEETK